MIDAVVGAVIMVMATTSLFLAVEVAENSFSKAGRYPVNDDEQVLLESLARSLSPDCNSDIDSDSTSCKALQLIGDVEDQVINRLPRQYQ